MLEGTQVLWEEKLSYYDPDGDAGVGGRGIV